MQASDSDESFETAESTLKQKVCQQPEEQQDQHEKTISQLV